jgi:LysR family nitrogen assimilation transcriptional regulator
MRELVSNPAAIYFINGRTGGSAVELHHLRCVVAVAENGSFTRAARDLHMTQPSLSYTIAKLEKELGARLFERGASSVTLTAAGAAFIEPARSAIREADRGKAAVEAVRGLIAGTLDVGCSRGALVQTAKFVADFHRDYPLVLVKLHQPVSDDAAQELLKTGQCEVVFVRDIRLSAEFFVVEVGRGYGVVIFPAPMAPQRDTVSWQELAHYPMVMPESGSPERAGYDRMFGRAGVTPVVAAESTSHEASLELVRGGVGAWFMPDAWVTRMNLDGLAVRHVENPLISRLVAAFRTSGLSPAATRFRDMLAASAETAATTN